MGYVAVAILVGTGLVNSWFLVGSPRALLNMPDGQVLIGKLVLFAAMLGLAAANRFLLVPSMIAALPGAASRLYKHVVSEQLLGVLILLTVSMLGTMRPAIGH
jgi:putative copper resistance protein D